MPQRIVGLLPSCKLLSRWIFPRMAVIDFPLNQKPVDGKHAASSVLTGFHRYFQRWWYGGLLQAGTHHQGGKQFITGHTPLSLRFTGEWHTPLKILINQIIFNLLWYLCSTNICLLCSLEWSAIFAKMSRVQIGFWSCGEGTCSSVCNTINLSFCVSGQPLLRSLVLWLQPIWTQMTWIWKMPKFCGVFFNFPSSVCRYCCSAEIFKTPQQSPTCGTCAFNLMISDSLRVSVLP